MSDYYNTFAVAGAGNVGKYVVEQLVKAGKTVVVLSRSADTKFTGATTKEVDYSSAASIEAALAGVEVVVAALGQMALAQQTVLADAAKKAGASLFLPVEYGNPTDQLTEGPLMAKKQVHDYLRSIDLPYLLVFTGPFPDFIFDPFLGFDLANGKAEIVGNGDTPVGFTARADVGWYIAKALLTRTSAALAWSILRVEGDRKTFNEAIALYSKLHDKKIDLTYISEEDAQREVDANPGFATFATWLKLSWARGESPYAGGKLDSEEWSEHKAQTLEDVFRA
ncbi:NAD P-binding protein [Pseudohyphozyma bogoriensis]|nr:NAD P-binding protein [Pseudohyphozyma bogoriensis]